MKHLLSPRHRRQLRKARAAQGLSQAELARRIKISNVQLCNLEAGKAQPSVATLSRWCQALSLQLRIEVSPDTSTD